MAFIDEIQIQVEAGKGGNGCVSFRREKFVPRGGPNGGDGGKGGSVYLEADSTVTTLFDLRYKRFYRAESGKPGEGSNCHGRNGEDLILKVPVGTVVGVVNEPVPLADLTLDKMRVQVAEGGAGGLGNTRFKSSVNRVPRQRTEGGLGEVQHITLELKLLADIGLVGMPNAGKSSLITALTKARPKIASYPFTTMSPHLGVFETKDFRRFILADIPGLIKGASEGVGLGHQFLKHVSRCRVLVHVLDVSEGPDAMEGLWERYIQVEEELAQYDPALVEKACVLVLNKLDALSPDAGRALVRDFRLKLAAREKAPAGDDGGSAASIVPSVAKVHTEVFGVSALAHQGLEDLKALFSIMPSLRNEPPLDGV